MKLKSTLSVIFIALLALMMIACNPEPVAHEHSWDKGVITSSPSCIEAGVKTYTCTGCKETKTETIPAIGHSWGNWIEIAQTCITDGSKTRTCSKCESTETETIKYDNKSHNYINESCSVCEALKTDIEAAVARVGKIYYTQFEDAVNEAQKLEKREERIVEVLKQQIDFPEHAPEVNNSITINCNDADFNRKDLAIYTYSHKVEANDTELVDIIVNDAKNLELWGQFSLLPENTSVNVKLNNVHNEGTSVTDPNGYLVMFRGVNPNSIINLSINNCSAAKVDNGIHFIYNGEVIIKDSKFTEVAVPINFAHKATLGDLNLVVENCEFINNGATETENPTLAAYSAPIRMTQTGEGSSGHITIKGNSVIGTRSTKGDVLLVDDRDGNVILPSTAVFEGNKTELKVLKEKGEDFVIVVANEALTLQAGLKPNTEN